MTTTQERQAKILQAMKHEPITYDEAAQVAGIEWMNALIILGGLVEDRMAVKHGNKWQATEKAHEANSE